MKRFAVPAAILFAVLAASGCSNKKKDLPPPPESVPAVDSGISTSGAPTSGMGSGSALPAPTATAAVPDYDLSTRAVYFELDSSDISTAGQGVIANFGKYLVKNPSAKVRLEGHTDERGSAEYNVALGERRAQSVSRELKALGVADGQLSVLSYGEERPAVSGSSEESWALNRRVELVQP